MSANFWLSSHCNKWLVDAQQLELSRRKDLVHGSETDINLLKILYGNFAQAMGRRMRLRQLVVATALVYFRRFYFRVDWAACDPLLAITTCLYLSAKVEETGIIPVYSIITQAQYVCNNEMDLIFQNAFNFTVNDVVESEFYILEELGCYLIIFHPYRPLTHYCHGLDDKQLLTTAWFILNDSYRTDLCLQYPPYMIALAALYLACIMKEKQLSPKMVEWFAELNVNPEELIEIATPILALYETWETFSSDKQAVRDALSRIPKPERAAAAAAAAAPSTSSPALLSNSYPQQGQK